MPLSKSFVTVDEAQRECLVCAFFLDGGLCGIGSGNGKTAGMTLSLPAQIGLSCRSAQDGGLCMRAENEPLASACCDAGLRGGASRGIGSGNGKTAGIGLLLCSKTADEDPGLAEQAEDAEVRAPEVEARELARR